MFAAHPIHGSLGRRAPQRTYGNVGVLEVFEGQCRDKTDAKSCAHHSHHGSQLFNLHERLQRGLEMMRRPLIYRLPYACAWRHVYEWLIDQGGWLNRLVVGRPLVLGMAGYEEVFVGHRVRLQFRMATQYAGQTQICLAVKNGFTTRCIQHIFDGDFDMGLLMRECF